MKSVAQLDSLTGLPNRLALDNYLDKLELSSQNGEKEYAILYIDLDGFKNINDTFGHHHGDMLLKEVGDKFKRCIRGNDFISRFGGDEFVIILNEIENIRQIDIIGNRIIQSIEGEIIIERDSLKVGCSIGVARWPTDNLILIRYYGMRMKPFIRPKQMVKIKSFIITRDNSFPCM